MIKSNKSHNALFSTILIIPFLYLTLFYGSIDELLSGNYLWFDDFDSKLISWIFERNYQALLRYPFNEFWEANQFFPVRNSLAYSDSIIAGQLYYFPLRYLGLNPLQSLFFTIFLIFVSASFLTGYLVQDLISLKRVELVVVVFICQFSMTITNFFGHYQLIAMVFAPSFFLAFFSYIKSPNGRTLLVLVAVFIFISSFATYFLPMAFVTCIILITASIPKRKNLLIEIKNSISRQYISYIFCTILLALFFKIQVTPYIEILSAIPAQDLMETFVYSAKLDSFFSGATSHSLVYKANVINGYWEYSSYPGAILLVFFIIGVVLSYKHIFARTMEFEYYLFVLFVTSFILSLGPYYVFENFNSDYKIKLPFYFLTKIIPGFERIRAPGRFSIFYCLPISIFALMTLRSIYSNHRLKFLRNIILCFAFVLIVRDSRIEAKTYKFDVPHVQFYRDNSTLFRKHEPTLILPLHGADHINTIKNYMNQLHLSNVVWFWVVAGYGSKSTEFLSRYTQYSKDLESAKINIDELICKAGSDGITKIVFHDQFIKKLIFKDNRICGFIKLFENDEGVVYGK